MKKLICALIFFCAAVSANAADIYISQSGAGTGASCASPKAVSFFNSSANWGSGATQIGAGTTVHTCGTITSDLSFQGDGASGSPVNLVSEPGSVLNAHVSTNGRNWWTIQKVTWGTGFPMDCSIVLNIPGGGNGYVANNMMDVRDPGPIIFLAQSSSASSLSHDITIGSNYMRNAATNTACQSDLIDTEGSYNITVEGNYFEMRSLNNDQHDDIIQTYQKGGSTAGSPRDWTIRNNKLVMNTTAPNNKSWMMMEALTGKVDIYGNIFVGIQGGDQGNGICFNSNTTGLTANINGNTIAQKPGGPNNLFNITGDGTFNVADNIVYNSTAGNSLTGGKALNRKNNNWFGPNGPSCNSTEQCGKDPQFTDFAKNVFTLKLTSPAIGAGANLGAAFALYPLASSTWPGPVTGVRPTAGAWTIGAYETGGAPPPPQVTITTTALPGGTVGVPYAASVQAAGGTLPYTWNITGLPGGLIASGAAISGTPTVAGTFPVTAKVTDSGSPPTSAAAPLSLVIAGSAPPTGIVCINSGGPAYTMGNGTQCLADKYFSGGNTFSTTHAISGTPDQTLYKSERWGVFTYTIPATPGTYGVTLGFAETSFPNVGQRVFNVSINGTQVLTNFDIVSAAGGEYIAYNQTFPVISTGAITISFIKGSADQPKIDVIQLVPGNVPPPPQLSISCPVAVLGVTNMGSGPYSMSVTSGGKTATCTANKP